MMCESTRWCCPGGAFPRHERQVQRHACRTVYKGDDGKNRREVSDGCILRKQSHPGAVGLQAFERRNRAHDSIYGSPRQYGLGQPRRSAAGNRRWRGRRLIGSGFMIPHRGSRSALAGAPTCRVGEQGWQETGANNESIAIIGIAAVPGRTTGSVLQLRGRSGRLREVTRIDATRCVLRPDPATPGKMKIAGRLSGRGSVRSNFLGSPSEACEEPQQRPSGVTWEALQDGAGARAPGRHTGRRIHRHRTTITAMQWHDLERMILRRHRHCHEIAANRLIYGSLSRDEYRHDTACPRHRCRHPSWSACGWRITWLCRGLNLLFASDCDRIAPKPAPWEDGLQRFEAGPRIRRSGVRCRRAEAPLEAGGGIVCRIPGSAGKGGRRTGSWRRSVGKEAVLREAYAKPPSRTARFTTGDHGRNSWAPAGEALGQCLASNGPGPASRLRSVKNTWSLEAAAVSRFDQGGAGAPASGEPAEPALEKPNPHIPLTS